MELPAKRQLGTDQTELTTILPNSRRLSGWSRDVATEFSIIKTSRSETLMWAALSQAQLLNWPGDDLCPKC